MIEDIIKKVKRKKVSTLTGYIWRMEHLQQEHDFLLDLIQEVRIDLAEQLAYMSYLLPTLNSWRNMHYKCTYRKNKPGRGTNVCMQWRDFKIFLEDMGIKPDGKALKRKDLNNDYSPDNCYYGFWGSDRIPAYFKSRKVPRSMPDYLLEGIEANVVKRIKLNRRE